MQYETKLSNRTGNRGIAPDFCINDVKISMALSVVGYGVTNPACLQFGHFICDDLVPNSVASQHLMHIHWKNQSEITRSVSVGNMSKMPQMFS